MGKENVVDEKLKKKKVEENVKLNLDTHLSSMNVAAATHNERLWAKAEDSFLSIIENNSYRGLNKKMREDYIKMYNNIIPKGDFFN